MSSGFTPYFVGPYKTGQQYDLDAYLIPEDAFPTLVNAYLWRGRIYKKGGNTLIGRLGVRQETFGTRGAGNTHVIGNLLSVPVEPGSIVITDGVTTFTDNGIGGFVITPGGNGTVNNPTNYTTGAIDVTFTVANLGATITATYIIAVSANSPVMGLRTFNLPMTNQEDLIAFDLLKAYRFNKILNIFQDITFYQTTLTPFSWTGSDTDFFYTSNYQNALFTTNNIPGAHAYQIMLITVTSGTTVDVTTTTANNFAAGDLVGFTNVFGMTQINGLTGTVTAPGNPFTVTLTSTAGFGVYSFPGGIAYELTNSTAGTGDGIKWMDGSYTWVNFSPPLISPNNLTPALQAFTGNPPLLQGCLIILPYKGYFVALNTWEGPLGSTVQNFAQRARWSQPGNSVGQGPVFYVPPLPNNSTALAAPTAWYQDLRQKGGFLDAPTNDTIVAAEFVKDVLVVYFEYSTYKLTPTGDLLTPFIWEKINTEIGASSTFSTIPYDRQIHSIGPYGAYACDSVGMERIDRKIPDTVFFFETQVNDNKRVYGIRDFYSEISMWTFPENDDESSYATVFPNRCLAYNYLEGSYSLFKNSYTCFGQYNQLTNLTWGGLSIQWDQANFTWNTNVKNKGFPVNVAGNQQGFVFVLQNDDGSPINGNSVSLSVQSITNAVPSVWTVINHNLQQNDFVLIGDIPNSTLLNGEVCKVGPNPTANTFTLIDINGLPVSNVAYTYGAFLAIADNFLIVSKNLNPNFNEGRSQRLGWTDFYVDNVDFGAVTINVTNSDDSGNISETKVLDLDYDANVVTELEPTKFWRRTHFNTQGTFIQFEITFSDAQMFEELFNKTFILHGMTLWMKPTGRITQ